MSFGKSKVNFTEDKRRVTFDDVAGLMRRKKSWKKLWSF